MMNKSMLERDELMSTVRAALESHRKLPHRGAQFSHREPRITNGYPQISRGEAPKLAVKSICYTLAFVLGVSQDHHLALVEVDLEARHLLEAQQKELEVLNITLRALHHDDGVIRILEKGDP